jgi:hypothetical protein
VGYRHPVRQKEAGEIKDTSKVQEHAIKINPTQFMVFRPVYKVK